MVFEYDGLCCWRGLSLTTKQRYHRLRVIVGTVCVVERVEQRHLRSGRHVDVAQFFLSQETLYDRLVALHELTHERLTVFVAIILCFHHESSFLDNNLQIERHLAAVVTKKNKFHRLATERIVVQRVSVPNKQRGRLQPQVIDGITIIV